MVEDEIAVRDALVPEVDVHRRVERTAPVQERVVLERVQDGAFGDQSDDQ